MKKFISILLTFFVVLFSSHVSARFLAVDPVKVVDQNGEINQDILANPQRLNLYTYAVNNPFKYVDPDGRDIAVVYGAPQGKNIFGHIGAGVTNKGIYSSGTKEDLGSSFSSYLKYQSTYRDSTVYVFPTSTEQDEAFTTAFKAARAKGHSASGNNCADILGAGLKAAGILKKPAALTFPGLINSYMMRKAYEGKVSSIVTIKEGNKEWKAIDKHLKQFDPKKE